jgi:hypothetical protein
VPERPILIDIRITLNRDTFFFDDNSWVNYGKDLRLFRGPHSKLWVSGDVGHSDMELGRKVALELWEPVFVKLDQLPEARDKFINIKGRQI